MLCIGELIRSANGAETYQLTILIFTVATGTTYTDTNANNNADTRINTKNIVSG